MMARVSLSRSYRFAWWRGTATYFTVPFSAKSGYANLQALHQFNLDVYLTSG